MVHIHCYHYYVIANTIEVLIVNPLIRHPQKSGIFDLLSVRIGWEPRGFKRMAVGPGFSYISFVNITAIRGNVGHGRHEKFY